MDENFLPTTTVDRYKGRSRKGAKTLPCIPSTFHRAILSLHVWRLPAPLVTMVVPFGHQVSV
jgi:hypothetical protein